MSIYSEKVIKSIFNKLNNIKKIIIILKLLAGNIDTAIEKY